MKIIIEGGGMVILTTHKDWRPLKWSKKLNCTLLRLLWVSHLSGDLRGLSEKLEEVIRRLDYIEAMIIETRKYPEIASLMRDLRIGAQLYDEPLKMIQRMIEVKRFLDRNEDSKDEITREILNSLALKGPMNVSETTREISGVRGKASRVTVKKRIDNLIVKGIIKKMENGRYKLP